jgi:hypothetical protein
VQAACPQAAGTRTIAVIPCFVQRIVALRCMRIFPNCQIPVARICFLVTVGKGRGKKKSVSVWGIAAVIVCLLFFVPTSQLLKGAVGSSPNPATGSPLAQFPAKPRCLRSWRFARVPRWRIYTGSPGVFGFLKNSPRGRPTKEGRRAVAKPRSKKKTKNTLELSYEMR